MPFLQFTLIYIHFYCYTPTLVYVSCKTLWLMLKNPKDLYYAFNNILQLTVPFIQYVLPELLVRR
jgi:hypothetical protein